MRKIKFRAWDINDKRLIDWSEWHDFWSGQEYSSLDSYVNNCNYIPMQFTGLIDKNGKEIWEGDIVKCPPILEGEYFNKVVEYIGGDFIANGSIGVNHHLLEVIGNVWENLDLLTKI